MTCPLCGSENIEVPRVDVGVGEVQCAPAYCLDCDWFEDDYRIAIKEQDEDR